MNGNYLVSLIERLDKIWIKLIFFAIETDFPPQNSEIK